MSFTPFRNEYKSDLVCAALTCWGWCCLRGEVFFWTSVPVWAWAARAAPHAAGSERRGGSGSALSGSAPWGSAEADSDAKTHTEGVSRSSKIPQRFRLNNKHNSCVFMSQRNYHKSHPATPNKQKRCEVLFITSL